MHADPLEEVFELLADGDRGSALDQLTQLLREEPYHGALYALRALVLADLGRFPAAAADVAEARNAAPDNPFVSYAAAALALQAGEVREAIAAARRARELAPDYDEAALLEARALAALGQWAEVAAISRRVAERDPSNDEAAVLEAVAEGAARGGALDRATWQELTTRFPLNPTARTASGWTRLSAGHARAAREEFEQALALDPSLPWAREGLVLALKARSPVYALLVRYFMWSGRWTQRTRTLMAIGGVLGYHFLRRLGEQQPTLEPLIFPVLIAYVLFVLLTWLADPLLNLSLMARAESRRLLSADDRRSGALVGLCLAAALVLAVAAVTSGWPNARLSAFAVGFGSLSVAAIFENPPSTKRDRLTVIAGLVLVLSLAAGITPEAYAIPCFALAILGVIVSTWYSRLARAVPLATNRS